MAQFIELDCVLNITTKGYDFKKTTTSKRKGAVKGTKCGKSATFGTCMQQWLGLGIMEDLLRQAKERDEPAVSAAPQISAEEARKAEIKGMNYRAIALIAESNTKAIHQVQAIAQRAEAEKEALAERLENVYRAREALM